MTLTPGGEKQVAMLVFCKILLLQFPGLNGMGEKGMLFYQGLFWAVYICSRTRKCPNGEKWSLAVLWEFLVIFQHGMWLLCNRCGRKWLKMDWCQVYFESYVSLSPFIGLLLWLNSLWVGCVAYVLCFRFWCFWWNIRSGALVPGVFNIRTFGVVIEIRLSRGYLVYLGDWNL